MSTSISRVSILLRVVVSDAQVNAKLGELSIQWPTIPRTILDGEAAVKSSDRTGCACLASLSFEVAIELGPRC